VSHAGWFSEALLKTEASVAALAAQHSNLLGAKM
jgi:hypothetical protein